MINLRSKWNKKHESSAQLFFYLADEGGNALHLSSQNLNVHEDSLLASGSRIDIGDWQLHLKSSVMLGNGVMVKCSTLCSLYYCCWEYYYSLSINCLLLAYTTSLKKPVMCLMQISRLPFSFDSLTFN